MATEKFKDIDIATIYARLMILETLTQSLSAALGIHVISTEKGEDNMKLVKHLASYETGFIEQMNKIIDENRGKVCIISCEGGELFWAAPGTKEYGILKQKSNVSKEAL